MSKKKQTNNNTSSGVQVLEKPEEAKATEVVEIKEIEVEKNNEPNKTKTTKNSKKDGTKNKIAESAKTSNKEATKTEKAKVDNAKSDSKVKEKKPKSNNVVKDNNDKSKNEVKTEKKEKVTKSAENKEVTVAKSAELNKTEESKKGLGTFSIFGILFAILILLILIGYIVFSFVISNNKNIYSGIYIKNVNVSDLSTDDAKKKLNKFIETSLPEDIILTHGDYEVALNTEELNIHFDIDSAVNTAYKLGRNNNFLINGFEVIMTSFNNKNVEPTFTIDDEALVNQLNDISSKLPDKMIESGYYIDGNNLILNKGTDGNVINVEKTKQKIKEAIKNLNLINKPIEVSVTPAIPSKLDVDKIYSEVHKDAVDATFTKEPLSVTPSKTGIDFAISIDEAKNKLSEDNQECVIPLKVVYPNYTTNMIGEEAFPDKLSEFSTKYAASNVNRTTNLRLAASKINGTVLMPGETFSYNQVVGERTIAAGYKEAPIYVSGRVEDGLGGGICQITTTLYNAVVYANLEIVERTNHQFVPSYVGAGRDATVVYGAIDFKFKNNRNYPIKLICSVSGGIAYFKVLGLKTADDYDVEIFSKITSQSASYTNSQTYKILKKNGSVVKEEILSKDTYKRH